jgi:hypothetical protein
MRGPVFAVVSFALGLVACPPADKTKPAPKEEGCTRVGQSCEFSPGKLGTCVVKDTCTDPPPACFVCQSQH